MKNVEKSMAQSHLTELKKMMVVKLTSIFIVVTMFAGCGQNVKVSATYDDLHGFSVFQSAPP